MYSSDLKGIKPSLGGHGIARLGKWEEVENTVLDLQPG